MWVFQLHKNKPQTSLLPTCNAIILSETIKNDLGQFHHASIGSPVPSTLLYAIDVGFLASFPGLTEKLLKKHLQKKSQTCKGHMDQEQKNVQSTQLKQKIKAGPSVNTKVESVNKVKIEPVKIWFNANLPSCTNLFICAIVTATNNMYSGLNG